MRLAAVAALVATATARPSDAAGATFPASRLITPAQGSLLNSWANQAVGQEWALCYTSFTMSKTSPAEFHRQCDQHKSTVTVAHNSGGRPGRCYFSWYYQDMSGGGTCSSIGSKCNDPDGGTAPFPSCDDVGGRGGSGTGTCVASCSIYETGCDAPVIGSPCGPTNPGNFTFGGYADEPWSGNRASKGTSATFIFGLEPREERFRPKVGKTNFQYAQTMDWPQWGLGDLVIGCATANCHPDGTGGAPGLHAMCDRGRTYNTTDGQICGGDLNWGETDLEVWRPVCRTDADCASDGGVPHHETCDQTDGSCRCVSHWKYDESGKCVYDVEIGVDGRKAVETTLVV